MADETPQPLATLIVDDEPLAIERMALICRDISMIQVVGTARDGVEALEQIERLQPQLVLLDLTMPEMDGFAVMEQLQKSLAPGEFVPIVVMSSGATPEMRRKAWALGARDFFTKPFDTNEFMLRVLNLLETRYLHLQLKHQNQFLEQRVQERTEKLRASQIEVLQRLGQAAEYRDDDTGQHTQRVGEMAGKIAAAMGLPPAEVETIRRAAPLHDVGKIGISEKILLKPGGLTSEEFELMKTHTTIGAGLLQGGDSAFLKTAEKIALSHHERWDGGGYPEGLSGEQIPLEARVVAIADVFDAISHDRPYKKAAPIKEAIAEIEKQAGTQFDPAAVAAFKQVVSFEHLSGNL